MTVTNTGSRGGATVAQLYLTSRAGAPLRRLVGYRRVELTPGQQAKVSLAIDPRLLADWRDGAWVMPAGDYVFAVGEDAETLGPGVSQLMAQRRWNDQPLSR